MANAFGGDGRRGDGDDAARPTIGAAIMAAGRRSGDLSEFTLLLCFMAEGAPRETPDLVGSPPRGVGSAAYDDRAA